MAKRNILLILGAVTVLSLGLFLVNWYLLPNSRANGIWILLGSSVGFASIFIFGLIGAAAAFGGLAKKPLKDDVTVLTQQIPETDKNFTGRVRELQILHREYSKGKINVLGIHGMGGVGKTTLGIAFANEIAKDFDHQLFIDMQGLDEKPVTAQEVMYHIIRSFQPSFSYVENESFLHGAYHSITSKNKILLVMDNIDDDARIQELIPRSGSILIFTSRRKFDILHAYSMVLPEMSEADARALLLKIVDKLTVSDADQIAKLCGYLPNAIVKAGKGLREYSNLSVPKYINDLSRENAKLGMIEATTSLSYKLLSEEMKESWRKLAVFPGDFGLEAVSKIIGCHPEYCEKILHDLYNLSLISVYFYVPTRKGLIGETRFRLHDLDRVFANTKLRDQERKNTEIKYAMYFDFVLQKIVMLSYEGGKNLLFALEAFDKEWKNIKLAQAIAKRYYKINENAAKCCIGIGTNSMKFLDLRLHRELQIEWSEDALRAVRRLKDVTTEAVVLGNLGTSLSDAGRVEESIPILTRALELSRSLGNARGEAIDLGNLANAYRRMNDSEKSLEYHFQSLEVIKEHNLKDLESGELNNIGNVYGDRIEGAKARSYYQKALDLAEERDDLREQANTLYCIATSYVREKEIIRSLKHYRSALILSRRLGDIKLENAVLLFYSELFNSFGLKFIGKKFSRDAQKSYEI